MQFSQEYNKKKNVLINHKKKVKTDGMFICNKKTPSGFHLQQQYSNIFIIITAAATTKKKNF